MELLCRARHSRPRISRRAVITASAGRLSEILERSALETLQAKAIEGIAYLRTARSDELVLETITKHPSRVVRAQAIAAFLFNHSYSPDALELAIKAARPDERIFVDRVVRREGEAAQDFNPKLDAFLKAHPEANPPAPTQREVDRTPQSPLPPDFYNRRR